MAKLILLTDVFIIGDVQRGPSSIVAAVGTARRATDAILSRENIRSHQNNKYWNDVNPAEIYQRKGDISITLVNSDDRDAFVAQEAARCLECNYVCSKCVDVCPNRANVSIAVPGFQNRFQTLHLDAYCNECGNCARSVRGTVNHTNKDRVSAWRKTLITAATQASLWKIASISASE